MREMLVGGVLILVLGGGAAVWWSQQSTSKTPEPASLTPAAPAEPEKPAKPAKRSAQPKVSIAQQKAPEPVAQDSPVAAALVPITKPAEIVQAAPPLPPMPVADQIAKGAETDSIVEQYGEPALFMTTSQNKHVIETMVYARPDAQKQTLIRIQDGRVVSAASLADGGRVSPAALRRVRAN